MSKIEIPKEIWDTYKVAKQFSVVSLMRECCRSLNTLEIVPSNALDVLELSYDMNFKNTRDNCVKLILDKTKEVKESYDLSDISRSMMHILIKSVINTPLIISGESKLELFYWIFAWGKNEFVENDQFNSTRSALEDFLPEIPFLELSNVEFAQLIEIYENVLETHEIVSIFMNIAVPNSKKMPHWYMSSAN